MKNRRHIQFLPAGSLRATGKRNRPFTDVRGFSAESLAAPRYRPVASALLRTYIVVSRSFARALSVGLMTWLWATIGWSATVRGAVAAEAAEPDRLEAARLEWSRARGEVARLQGVQSVLRAELRQVSSEIEQNKQQGERGGLEDRLRRSQELSYRLSTLARELSTAETRSDAARSALSGALSIGLEALQSRWEATPERAARQALVVQMRALRSEREALRTEEEATQMLGGEPMGALAAHQALDDPRELLEQADALRDAEDKVRERLHQLDLRIAEARQERELDRRMGQTMADSGQPGTTRVRATGAPAVGDSSGEAIPAGSTTVVPSMGTELPIPSELPELTDYADLRLLEEQRSELKITADRLRARAVEYEVRAHQLK